MTHERLYLRLDGDPLYAPETSVPWGTMRELPVWQELQQHVAHIAVYRESLPAMVVERVVPDGAVRLMFDLGTAGGKAMVAGPSVQPVRLQLQGTMAGLTVTLRPGAAAELLKIPASHIQEQCPPLEELIRGDSHELCDRLFSAKDDKDRSGIVQSLLRKRLAGDHSGSRRTLRALRVLSNSHRTLPEAADALGIGERRLQQLFEDQVGLAPRLYRRLARVHACLRSLRCNVRPSWSALALEHGFSDQAHLSREFRTFVGLPPTAYVARVSGSFKTAR